LGGKKPTVEARRSVREGGGTRKKKPEALKPAHENETANTTGKKEQILGIGAILKPHSLRKLQNRRRKVLSNARGQRKEKQGQCTGRTASRPSRWVDSGLRIRLSGYGKRTRGSSDPSAGVESN